MSELHIVKCLPHFFSSVWDDIKPFEIRANDRNYRSGDYLIQREFLMPEGKFTGRMVIQRIGYMTDYNQPDQQVVFATETLEKFDGEI